MTEELPNVPQAYQPPVSQPADPYEPTVVPAYQPNPYQQPFYPAQPAFYPQLPKNRGRRVFLFVGGTVLVFVISFAIAMTRDGDPESAESAAVPAPVVSVTLAPTPVAGWAELPPLPPSAEATAADATDGAATSVAFVNTTAGPVSVWWLDYDHKRVHYQDLQPGQEYLQPTYTGHVWVVTTADGTATALFEATSGPGRAVIR
ncbi:hypothetical protein [Actinoplanes sp. L3-i22]|uniref:VHL beta domain-containing protein n=1 Tax=Actinoplanes sp. L3-i22 TaxID=2836373 RepID=UPI001C752AD4|nr:hypothetical protein [Actinoplanes sp. L3-i22]BCY08370.1 hypothetical protein L3i22_034580 [Actinoplanes sp. L3-i22]